MVTEGQRKGFLCVLCLPGSGCCPPSQQQPQPQAYRESYKAGTNQPWVSLAGL